MGYMYMHMYMYPMEYACALDLCAKSLRHSCARACQLIITAFLIVMDTCMYVRTCMSTNYNGIPDRDGHMHVCTYVHHENISLVQSLTLMHSCSNKTVTVIRYWLCLLFILQY